MPKNDLEILKHMTRDCRPDMHEPDEQGLDAEFGPSFRYHGAGMDKIPFDNASSPNPQYEDKRGLDMDKMDMGFWLIRKDGKRVERHWFNLANILALARKAQQE